MLSSPIIGELTDFQVNPIFQVCFENLMEH
jgi:hypothetical protein